MGISERKEREKERRRKEIVEAAEKIFFSKGFESATMDEIAAGAELSKGTLYLYFKSKQDLYFAIFVRGSDILIKMMRERLSDKADGYHNLLELASAFILFSSEYPDYFQLFMFFQSSLRDLNIDEKQLEVFLREQSPLALVNENVLKGMEDGSLRRDLSAENFSATLWSQLLGVLTILNSKSELYEIFNLNPVEILATHLELVSHGGRAQHGGKVKPD